MCKKWNIILLCVMLCACSAEVDVPSGRRSYTHIQQTQRYIGTSPVRGPRNAKVTMIVFSDFECGHCRDLAETLHDVYADYPGKVNIVYKNLPLGFHRQARSAAMAAMAAGEQGKFWEMHDLIFENQTLLSRDFYIQAALQLGLDVTRFQRDLKNKDLARRIRQDESLAAQWAIRSTPRLLVNGEMLIGAQPRPVIEGLIRRYL